ncbi:MAG TPA: isoleucine--tRNA ligase, partial [Myxococcales bacterium]|nr:isoleucine--tRNA ligase [Myxococcales bacterium]
LPSRKAESIFFTGMPEAAPLPGDEQVLAELGRLFEVRGEVQRVLEAARREKLIGSALEAKLTLYAEGEVGELLKSRAAELPALFIVSKVSLAPQPPEGAVKAAALPLHVKVERAPGQKCPRCWTYSEAIDGQHPVCPKCAEALGG